MQQGTYRDPTPVLTGLERGNDLYGGDTTPWYEFNDATAVPSGPQNPQPLHYNEYTMVSMFYTMSMDEHPHSYRFHEVKYPIQ